MDVVDLDSVDLTDFTDSERAIFNVLRATLQYPATPSAKNEKLANDMIFLCKKQDADVGGMLWGIWTTLIDIVYLIPPDHPWQNSLVQSLLILRRLEDHATDDGKVRTASGLVRSMEIVMTDGAIFPVNYGERSSWL